MRETIDAALREVVDAKRRLELITLLGEEGRFDFEAAEAAWGAGRRWRAPAISPTRASSDACRNRR